MEQVSDGTDRLDRDRRDRWMDGWIEIDGQAQRVEGGQTDSPEKKGQLQQKPGRRIEAMEHRNENERRSEKKKKKEKHQRSAQPTVSEKTPPSERRESARSPHPPTKPKKNVTRKSGEEPKIQGKGSGEGPGTRGSKLKLVPAVRLVACCSACCRRRGCKFFRRGIGPECDTACARSDFSAPC